MPDAVGRAPARAKGPSLRLTRERRWALGATVVSATVVAILAVAPDHARSVVAGPMMPGHEAISCARCHLPAPGTFRQQVQANVHHWLGLRATAASFGREAATSKPCVDCHDRDNDRHPIYRFREPRFAEAVKALDARNCLSCHDEHKGARVSNGGAFCRHCHDEMKPRKDPIAPGHAELAAAGRWTTCLTCHDFHGNHAVKAPTDHARAHEAQAIRDYLGDGPDPYAPTKIRKAKSP